jgi:hypothetical protein
MSTNLLSTMGSRSDIAQYKIETPPMPSMTPSDAYQPDDGLMTEDDTSRDETLRHLVKGVAPSKKNARELNLLAVGDDDTTPQPTASASPPGFGWARNVETINVAPGMQQTRTLSTPTSPMVKMTTTNKHQKVAKGQTLL